MFLFCIDMETIRVFDVLEINIHTDIAIEILNYK